MEETVGVFRASRTVSDWKKFQAKQKAKYFARKPRPGGASSQEETGWELNVVSVSNIPSVAEGVRFKFYFTFFDLETKEFFGNTLVSECVQPTHRDGSWICSADKKVNFWSSFNMSKTVVVLELVKVQLCEKNVVEVFEESLGWVPVPLNVLDGSQGKENEGKLFEIPLLEGTPRILLFSGMSQGKALGNCKMVFSVRHNGNFLAACGSLVNDSCMVDARDLIPGLSRFDSKGLETLRIFGCTTPVDWPQRTPTYDVKVRNIHVSLPPNYIETVLGELLRDVQGWSKWLKDNFYVKVAAHNGRREIRGTSRRERLKCLKLSQDTHLQLDSDLVIENVPEDEFITMVIEVFVDTSSIESGDKILLGWLPHSIFSDERSAQQINQPLECGPGTFIDGSPLLNWQAMITEDPKHAMFSPTVFCQVITGPREPRILKFLPPEKATVQSLDQSMGSRAAETSQPQVSENSPPKQAAEAKKETAAAVASVSQQEHSVPEKSIRVEPPKEAPGPVEPPKRSVAESRPKPPLPAIIAAPKEGRPRPRPPRPPIVAQPPQLQPQRGETKKVIAKKLVGRPVSAKLTKQEASVSRATKAKMNLQDVKIPSGSDPQGRILPSQGEPGKAGPDLEAEKSDTRMVNEIVVQLLAFKSGISDSKLKALYFSLNFFDFSESVTPKVDLERSGDSDVYLFKKAERGAAVSPEGLNLKFKVDKDDKDGLADRRERLVDYLYAKKLQINVWDGKSMLQKGFATVDLRSLLRQGKDVVEHLQEVDIEEVAGLDSSRKESLKLSGLGEGEEATGSAGPKPSLIVRLINVGSEKALEGTARGSVNLDNTKRSLLKRPEVVMQELHINPNDSGSLIHQLIETEKRRYKRKERYLGHSVTDNYELGYKIRQKLHEDVCHVKGMKRENLIKSKLRQKLIGKKMLKARVGEVLFFEEKFSNPRGGNRTFRIDVSDPELSLVMQANEWAHLRSMKKAQSASVPESDILDGNRLFLGSYDECHVPFKYCPLQSATTSQSSVTEKVIQVSLVCENTGVVESQLEILIEVLPCIVDQTFKLHTPEFSAFKQSFDLAAGLGRSVSASAEALANVTSVQANDPNVVVKLNGGEGGRKEELVIKCSKSGPAPEERDFLCFFYGDKFQSKLLQVWRFAVATVRKLDVSGLTGQTTISNLVVKGAPMSQKVRCFTSHPEEVQVVPEEFTLISDALSEVKVSFCPLIAGRLDALLNIVNMESGALVQSILVSARGEDPPVSKTYEAQVIAGSAHESKISYENAWSSRKTFSFKPAHPWLIKVDPGYLNLEAGATGIANITFRAPNLRPGMYETLVFINDTDNNNEDCVRIQFKVLAR